MGNLIDREALKKAIEHLQYTEEFCIKHQIDNSISLSILEKIIDNAQTVEPCIEYGTVEPRIEYGTDGQPYRLFMSSGQVVPDMLQGWRYQEGDDNCGK